MHKQNPTIYLRSLILLSTLFLTSCFSESTNPSTGSKEYSGRGRLELDYGLTYSGLLENASAGLIYVLSEGLSPGECRELNFDSRVMDNGKLKRTKVDGEACRKSKE